MATPPQKRTSRTNSTNSANNKTTIQKRKTKQKVDPRALQILGVFLCFLSVFLIISFVPYFFTWKADYDVVSLPLSKILTGEHDSRNLLGTYGAAISHIFVTRFFGAASIILALYFGLCGFDLLSKKHNFNLKEYGINAIVATIFTSIVLGFFFSNSLTPWAGLFGFNINNWLFGIIGKVGTFFIILTTVIAGIIVYFNLSVDPIITFFKSLKFPQFSLPAMPTLSLSSIFSSKKSSSNDSNKEGKRKKPSDVMKENMYAIDNVEYGDNDDLDDDDDDYHNTVKTNPKPQTPLEMEIEIGGYGDDELPFPNSEPSFKRNKPLDIEVEVIDLPKQTNIKPPRPDRLQNSDQDDNDNNDNNDDFDDDAPFTPGNYDPTLDLANYKFPSIEFLEPHGQDKIGLNQQELQENTRQIIETLKNFGIEITKISAKFGPTITLFELVPAPGVRISRIRSLEDDIALSLAALGIRIIAPIPGKGTIGIEVPNRVKETVSLRSMINTEAFRDAKMELPVALGTSISMGNYIADLTKMPHLLMAGATGQGKSVGINTILISLLYAKHPAELKFVLIDPKKVELSIYNKIEKHFLAKLPSEEESIITDTSKSIHTLNALCIEMDNRYDLLKDAHVRNIKEYNAKFKARRLNPAKGHRYLPYLVLVIDEFADLMMTAGKEVELPLTRLAQLARAVGVHLIISTQRPTVNIITGTIKANFPVRIAFRVMSKVDSKTIIDKSGADQLIGRGDMLLVTGADTYRLQCAFVDTPEVERITDFIGAQQGYASAFELPEVADEEGGVVNVKMMEKDAFFEEAAHLIVSTQQGSTSQIQRKMKLGYNRAGRIMDQLEAAGIVGPTVGSKPREVLIQDILSLEQYLQQIR